MQKLSGISSHENNKSCRIFHHESKKISFEFFQFFYNFICNLQETGKSLYYWSYPFAGRPSKIKVALQCSPWGRLAGAVEQNPARLAGVLAGEGQGKGLGATGTRFGRSAGAVVAAASGHAGGQGGGRRGCRSPARSGLGERETGRLAYVDAREGGGVLFGLQLARDRSSPRPGARLPTGGAVGRGGVCASG
jgi:hypothetical protein